MTGADYAPVFALWQHSPGIGLRDLDDSEPGIKKFLERNPGTCFVAEQDGALVGAILSGHDGRRGYIYHTAVHTAFQHRGIGTALVSSVQTALQQAGIRKVATVVFSDNDMGNQFWERQDFSVRDDLTYRNKDIN
jgi:ribosomal protein S18 acetylase RimI-like enzyme